MTVPTRRMAGRALLCGALRWRWRARAAALLLLLGAAALRLPRDAHSAAEFPHHTPAALAHFLADFSNHPLLDDQIGSWSVEEEAGNFTWWRYSVAYSCGARCGGRAELESHATHQAGAPRHGAASAHSLRVRDVRCTSLPLLSWPQVCEETESETVISERAGGGARLQEAARVWWPAYAVLAAPQRLRAERQRRLRALRAAL